MLEKGLLQPLRHQCRVGRTLGCPCAIAIVGEPPVRKLGYSQIQQTVTGSRVPAEDRRLPRLGIRSVILAGRQIGDIANAANVLHSGRLLGMTEQVGIHLGYERRTFAAHRDISGTEIADGGQSGLLGDRGASSQLQAIAQAGVAGTMEHGLPVRPNQVSRGQVSLNCDRGIGKGSGDRVIQRR